MALSKWQMTSSADDGQSWSSFSSITIDGYEYPQGDIYFFSAMANPVHNRCGLCVSLCALHLGMQRSRAISNG